MNDFPVVGDGDGLCRIQRPFDILLVHDTAGNANYTAAVHGGDMRSGQADQGCIDFESGSAFCFLNGARNGQSGSIQVNNRAFSQAL